VANRKHSEESSGEPLCYDVVPQLSHKSLPPLLVRQMMLLEKNSGSKNEQDEGCLVVALCLLSIPILTVGIEKDQCISYSLGILDSSRTL
jgi:hypothetical protein